MLVRHLMSRGVFTVREDETCRDVLELFRRERIRRAPVVRGDAQELCGILSERDILRVMPTSVAMIECAIERGIASPKVAVAMTQHVLTVAPDRHVEEAANLMYLRRIGAVPVVDDGKLVGMLTETDVFRAYVTLWRDDATLRVTLTDPHSDDRARQPDEPLRIALALELHVTGLNTYDAPGGVKLTSLRVSGARVNELPERLSARGWTLLEVERRDIAKVA
ncbi:MAG: CBS domain-containing protein [Planctomycetes bacterium]|nr:CBS domain-containing protein [Planctomycetota bacterium]